MSVIYPTLQIYCKTPSAISDEALYKYYKKEKLLPIKTYRIILAYIVFLWLSVVR